MDSFDRGMTPEKIQVFLAGLSGMAPEEIQKAKLLFLKNELSRAKTTREAMAGFGMATGCFSIIPIFWPILGAQKRMMNAEMMGQVQQLRNALEVWKDDLGTQGMELERELEIFEQDLKAGR
ncbi:MAG: hypothetical protein ACK57Y_15640 [Pirellulaceae bacterium]|jgi:hypothetical protein